MKASKLIAGALALLLPVLGASCGDKKEEVYNYSSGLDENGFFEGIKATDYVTVPEYKGIELDRAVLVAAEEDVDEQINTVLESHGSYEQLTTGTIKDGDTVNIDYVGSVDGVEFDGGSTGGQGTEVTIGVTSYIDDFLEQLIGHKPGETVNVEVTFPTPYESNPDLAGKDALFVTKINYIRGELILPELDAALAESYGFDSVDAMIADIEAWIIERQKLKVMTDLAESATVSEIPDSVIEYIIDSDLNQLEKNAAMYGINAKTMLKYFYGIESIEAYVEQSMPSYEQSAKVYLVVQAIAELEGANLAITDADIEAAGMTDYVKDYGKPYINQFVLFQTKLPQFIIDNAVIK